MAAPHICQVLVVGAGPVGLAAAVELQRRGVSLKIIERDMAPSPASKAVGINARTLELLEPSGVTERLLAAGTRIHRANIYYEGNKQTVIDFSRMRHRFNFLLALPQNETERILEAALRENGVAVQRGTTLTAITKTSQGVLATGDRIDEEPLQYNAGLVLGADGIHSTVRELANIEFAGYRYDDQFSLADVELEWDYAYHEAQVFLHRDKPLLFVIAIGRGRHRLVSNHPDALELLPPGATLRKVNWQSKFSVSLRHVKTYQSGLLFLAGDAAHVHSPAGGRGMNLGIEDACSFARRVVDGGLARYSDDRLPIGSKVIRITDRMFRVASSRNPVKQRLRNLFLKHILSREFVQARFRWEMSGLGHPLE